MCCQSTGRRTSLLTSAVGERRRKERYAQSCARRVVMSSVTCSFATHNFPPLPLLPLARPIEVNLTKHVPDEMNIVFTITQVGTFAVKGFPPLALSVDSYFHVLHPWPISPKLCRTLYCNCCASSRELHSVSLTCVSSTPPLTCHFLFSIFHACAKKKEIRMTRHGLVVHFRTSVHFCKK